MDNVPKIKTEFGFEDENRPPHAARQSHAPPMSPQTPVN